MRHVYNGTDFINYVLCEIFTTKLFVICVLYFVRNDKIKMFNQSYNVLCSMGDGPVFVEYQYGHECNVDIGVLSIFT